MAVKYFFIFFFILLSCNRSSTSKYIISPSKFYKLQSVSENHLITIKLFDDKNILLSQLETGGSGYSKWAINWHPLRDTIILISKDIGIFAWRITENKNLEKIAISLDIDVAAIDIFNKKYGK